MAAKQISKFNTHERSRKFSGKSILQLGHTSSNSIYVIASLRFKGPKARYVIKTFCSRMSSSQTILKRNLTIISAKIWIFATRLPNSEKGK